MADLPTDSQAASADDAPRSESKPSRTRRKQPLLFEVAWEVCNQVGGIYTVLRSKVPAMVKKWKSRYCLIGPYEPATASVEFESAPPSGDLGQAIKQLRDAGINAHYGRWVVTGKPNVVLLDYRDLMGRLDQIKYHLWEQHQIELPGGDVLIDKCVAFGEAVRQLLTALGQLAAGRRQIVAHFHEWMAGVSIPMLRYERWPGATVFTTHATLLGRYLAMNSETYYDHLPFYDPFAEAKRFNCEPIFQLERAATHSAHVFTTVSDVTAEECRHLLGRAPEPVTVNGLNIKRFERLHQLQIMHRQFKERIHRFTIGHFFPSYTFDLEETLYFFTSGRYEYKNKGMDLTIEALARLNHKLKDEGSKKTVVAFIITRRPYKSINVNALQSQAMLTEFETIVEAIKKQVGERLFEKIARGQEPDLNTLADEYWKLRMRRGIQAWKRIMPPPIVTHDLIDDEKDEVLNQLRTCRLWNEEHDRVKIVYHPDFVTPTSPLFGMDYDQFVRGCHMGVFPSYYEPWGYTPVESAALGVPAICSDLSGFGSYVQKLLPKAPEHGLYVIHRRGKTWHMAADEIAWRMHEFCKLDRRGRISLRNAVEGFAAHFDWNNLFDQYQEAHDLAIQRLG